ncbi:cupin domain-containing protein [Emcibacter sp. SYSU 3D8]|uniref:cupin domain-containing protein n=1 Tax=Emcibacter sp. SYSU 3D8 TaxID=3133969 RepID=UPI0031FEB8FE
MKSISVLIAAGAAILFTTGAQALDKLGYPARELLVTSTDVLGQPLVFPTGTVKITSAIITIQPGGAGQLHRHDVPMYAYILQGEITVDYGPHGTKVYRQGEAIMEAEHVPHKGMNTGDEAASLLVVYMGVDGIANATPVK